MPEKKESKPKKYIATTGMNLGSLKASPRIEKGDLLPEGLDKEVIADLLAIGDIKEAK